MLESLPTRSQEIIIANMRQSMSLTLGILMSLYPRANLDMEGEGFLVGFLVTCSDEESLKLIEDFVVTAGHVIDMLGVDMFLG
jgi:hypothetical protein